jgi:hypothetical protein
VNGSKSLRCHAIDWNKVTESGFGFPNEDELVDKPYQFQLSSNEHGRVHGFFIDEVFYVVWLDLNISCILKKNRFYPLRPCYSIKSNDRSYEKKLVYGGFWIFSTSSKNILVDYINDV